MNQATLNSDIRLKRQILVNLILFGVVVVIMCIEIG